MKLNGVVISLTVRVKGAKLVIEVIGISEKGIVEELTKWASTSQELTLNIKKDDTQTKLGE